jgi:hypothetical protein
MFVASMEQKRHRSRDFGLYVAIGTLVAVLAMGYGVYMAKAGKPLVFKNDWSVTIATAGLVFGYAIKEHWPQRRMKKFWAAWVGLLVAHFAVLLPIFRRMEQVPLVLIAIISPIELLIVYRLLDSICPFSRRSHT